MIYESKWPPSLGAMDERPLGESILEAMEGHSHGVALINGVTGEEVSYAQLCAWIRSVETGLADAGLRQSDVVAAVLPNCPEWAVMWLALLRRGAVLSGVNPAYTKEEIIHHLKDCRARWAFTDADNVERVAAAVSEVGGAVEAIFVVCSARQAAELPPKARPFHSLRVHPKPLAKADIDPKTALACLPYSSGTTGPPKGVMVSHAALSALALLRLNPDLERLVPGERSLAYLPFFHIYGLAINLLLGLISGVALVVMPHFQPQLFLRLLQDHKVRALFTVPPILVWLTSDPSTDEYDLSCLRRVGVGAAPAGQDMIQAFQAKFPHVEYVLQGYGLTESGGGAHAMPANDLSASKQGSCGMLIQNFQARIVDPETGKDVEGLGKRGEIWLRGPSMMLGYLNRPQATAETIDSQGWLHTGDIGYVDEDGYWYVVDRIKELIKVKGFQVAPAELEDLLLSHPSIADAAVIGVPHPKDGEVPRAFVVAKAGASLRPDEVAEFVAARVAPYKRLRGGVEMVNAVPKSPSGKILRRLLREQVKAKL